MRLAHFLVGFLVATSSALTMSCASSGGGDTGHAPEMAPLSDTTVYVDTVFTLELSAHDPEGDRVTFGFTADVADIGTRAELVQAHDKAIFRWTPIAADVGLHTFDFTASDGTHTSKQTITIDVQPQVGSSTAPIFREPLGNGTMLDLTKSKCMDLKIVVEDADSAGVTISQIGKPIKDAKLDQDSGLTATWHWCPSKEQLNASDRYLLSLQADDNDEHKTRKDFLIVLRKPTKTGCPGGSPQIVHTPEDVSSVVNLTVMAKISDDKGIKYDPLFYYTTKKPGATPNLADMTQTTMVLLDGDRRNGTWGADVPNPVATGHAGDKANLYYIIVAQDNDDETGDCDHVTQAPDSGTFEITVSNPGGSGGLEPCKPCSTDNQCGKDGDNCLRIGNEGNTFCAKKCSSKSDCPSGYNCPDTPYTSVDGHNGRQCIPDTFRCDGSGSGTCQDDDHEPNDSTQQALLAPNMEKGKTVSNLVSCPGDASMGSNDDLYPISLPEEGKVYLKLSGGDATDLDMVLADSTGKRIASATTLSSNEHLERCLPQDYYFVDVYSWDSGRNTYSLTYDFEPATCVKSCDDDDHEDDDDTTNARVVNLSAGKFVSETNSICPYDEDWYKVDLKAGDTLYVSLTFDQQNSSEDLDINLYKGASAKPLTPCSVWDVNSCDDKNGQSMTSDEHLTWPIMITDTYYVVARGFDGGSNLYDICISTTASDCPAPGSN